MPVVTDRTKELTNTAGTGALTLTGAVTGFRSFNAAVGVGVSCYYALLDGNGTGWETGTGSLSSSTVFVRTTVSKSSNSNAAISLSAGTHTIFSSLIEAFATSKLDATANAVSATVLATPRAINGVNFDGSAAITVAAAAATLTGTALPVTVVSSSLTSVGTLASLTLAGAVTGVTDLTTTGNTILGNASTDTLNVGNGGIIKDASGNVGIGTGTIITKLHVFAGVGSGIRVEEPGGVKADLSVNSTNFSLGVKSNHPLLLVVNDVERMRLETSGNVSVGIGTNLAKLHVFAPVGGGMRLEEPGGVKADFSVNSANFSLGSKSNHPLLLMANDVERARIDTSGNLIHDVPATPPTLATNSQMVANLTSNANLRLSVRGTDGTTRVVNLTLA